MGLALSLVAGTALPLAGFSFPPALLLLSILLLPIAAWRRPGLPGEAHVPVASGLALLAGYCAATAALHSSSADCRLFLPAEGTFTVLGRFEGRPAAGPAPFRVEGGLPGGCRGVLRVALRDGVVAPLPGAPVQVTGRWRRAPEPDPRRPEWSGTLVGVAVETLPGGTLPAAPVLAFRGRIQERLALLFGERAPVVEALVLARREGVAPELREAFARSGTAHLLAISGFHVGVVAGLLYTLLRRSGRSRERSALLAAVGAWVYVLGIGAPHAAARAAALVSAGAAARMRGRPVHPAGALAAAALLLVALDPESTGAVGFQLSFAGAAGLLLMRPPVERWFRHLGGERLPAWGVDALAAGVAATVATTPLAAWYFNQVPLLGIPATLVVGPVVALAIPGVFLALLLHPLLPPLAHFVAGGTGLLLAGVEEGVVRAAAPGWVALWVDRPTLAVLGAGAVGGAILLRGVPGSVLGPRVRRGAMVASALVFLLLQPVAARWWGKGELHLTVLDVGQGDAVTLRTPSGRWIVVDTGPRSPTWDAGARVVLPHLRRQGARRVDLLVLTHPHLDHVGGAESLMRGIEVGRVGDPGHPAARAFYTGLLGLASHDRVGWWPMQAGESVEVDGVHLRVLNPVPGADTVAPSHGANTLSVVLEVRYGAFAALLTGDAPEEVEALLAASGELGSLQVLKVGHHGSRTSTGWGLLEAATPEVAIIPVGRGNPFGHPHDRVLHRLERAGVRVLRTDHHGTVTVRARLDGDYRVRTARGRMDPPPRTPDFRSTPGTSGNAPFGGILPAAGSPRSPRSAPRVQRGPRSPPTRVPSDRSHEREPRRHPGTPHHRAGASASRGNGSVQRHPLRHRAGGEAHRP